MGLAFSGVFFVKGYPERGKKLLSNIIFLNYTQKPFESFESFPILMHIQ